MEETRTTGNTKLLIGLGLFVILGIPLIFYFGYFHNGFSSKQEHWGAFGDYINPFLAILNLAALLYLTKIVADREGKQQQQSLDVQLRIQDAQMRNEVILELSKIMDTIKMITDEDEMNLELFDSKVDNVERTFNSFCTYNNILFDDIFDTDAYKQQWVKFRGLFNQMKYFTKNFLKSSEEYKEILEEIENKKKMRKDGVIQEKLEQLISELKIKKGTTFIEFQHNAAEMTKQITSYDEEKKKFITGLNTLTRNELKGKVKR